MYKRLAAEFSRIVESITFFFFNWKSLKPYFRKPYNYMFNRFTMFMLFLFFFFSPKLKIKRKFNKNLTYYNILKREIWRRNKILKINRKRITW